MKINTVATILFFGLTLLAAVAGLRLAIARSSLSYSSTGVTADTTTLTGMNVDADPVLVELFTSGGCSSCPPADQVLSRLDKERSISGTSIIVLSQHVDYWNHLGWRDPYSSSQFSERQSSYASAFGRNGVYTPQMVVDGRLEFVGSSITKAHEAIIKAGELLKAKVELGVVHPKVSHNDSVQLTVRIGYLPPISIGDTAEVFLAIAENDLSSSVARGENAGRNLRHTAVVRQLGVIGKISEAKGEAPFTAEPTVHIDGGWHRDKLRVIVFVQERVSRHVIGAAMVEVH